MSRLGLVVNPTAGHGRGSRAGRAAHAGLRAAGHTVTDLSAPSLAAATDAARAAVLAGLDALVVVGGDGTTHLGVNVVVGTDVPLGVVATGSGDDLARRLGLPVHDVDAAVAAVDAGLRDGPVAIDAMAVRHPDQQAVEWCLGVLSVGIDAAVNARANQLRFPPGTARYVRALLHELRGYRPFGYRVDDDTGTRPVHGPLVAVANLSDFGGGMRIAPHADPTDGRLDVVTAGPLTRAQLVAVFPRIFTGGHLNHPQVHEHRTRRIEIRADLQVGAAPPVAYADGERVAPLPLVAEVVPGALAVLGARLPGAAGRPTAPGGDVTG